MSLFHTKTKCNFSYGFMAQIVARYEQAQVHNKVAFADFKNAFYGKDVVLMAAGPSVNDFVPISNAIYVGMNRSILYDKVKFNFLFAIDMLGIRSFIDEFISYEGNNCIKFIGYQGEGKGRAIPESLFLKLKNARKYKTDAGLKAVGSIPVDIDILPLWNSCSVAHQVMQFALFGNPRKIYLVGCDSNGIKNGHFAEGKDDKDMVSSFSDEFWKKNLERLIVGWDKLKDFAETYYPDTEIISVNPVGLKGMFRDVYTRSYLAKHPEIRVEDIEVIDD